jgi:hypothetical protein
MAKPGEDELVEESAEEASSGEASSQSSRGRPLRPRVIFSPDTNKKASNPPKKRKGAAEAPEEPAPRTAAEDGTSASTASPTKKRKPTETKASLCKWRNHAQAPVWPKEMLEPEKDMVSYAPWQTKILLCLKLRLDRGTDHKLEIKAGDTFSAYSTIPAQRKVPYTVCWFEKEPGQNSWSVYGVRDDSADYIRTPVTELINHTQKDSAATQALRDEAYNAKAKKETDALGARNTTGRMRGTSGRQWASRNKAHTNKVSISSDVGEVVAELRAEVAAATELVGRLEAALAATTEALKAAQECNKVSAKQMEWLEGLFKMECARR